MKKLVLLCFMLLWGVCWAEESIHSICDANHQSVSLTFKESGTNTINLTAYKGEIKAIPMTLLYSYMHGLKIWALPRNPLVVGVENLGPLCPGLVNDRDCNPYRNAICNMNVILHTEALDIGQVVSGQFSYLIEHKKHPHLYVMNYVVTIIHRPLSMQVIAPQDATVGKEFYFSLKNVVNNYLESVSNEAPVFLMMKDGEAVALNNIGLYFDKNDFSIRGFPNQAGEIKFHVGATNVLSKTDLVPMTIAVQYNVQNKPRFQSNISIPSAAPHKEYQLNLMTLLENAPEFNNTNQVTFKFDDNSKVKSGFALSAENHLVLEGEPNPELAGDMAILTVVATSNTGGDSLPYQLRIPVAYDSSKRPSIEPFELEQSVEEQFSVDLSQYIKDPAQDLSLVVKIDQIEPTLEKIDDPKAFRIQISPQKPKVLEGYIPENAVGKKYYITLHANTHTGGDSEKIIVPLQVSIDETLTPRFRQDNPQLPLLIPGQPFTHDFVANRDVWPEYENMPYEISFAEDYSPPQWLKLENNKLFSVANVPMATKDIEVTLVIKNIPGGVSNPITLSLTVP
ncbi:MAG: hypothetical protein P4L79_09070, partial [Legionella sp.]|uniref:hypothetical protein n=1 Tax=Legionella sp. TaxID=459 RepID=UPI002844DDB5|nr:hypothetical protein [Legionella sp.]